MSWTHEKQLLDLRVCLEELITEREGMVAENRHQESCGNSIPYASHEFQTLGNKIACLINQVRMVGRE